MLNSSYGLGIVLSFLLLLISAFTIKQRGVSWDEPTQRDSIGYPAYNYMFNSDTTLFHSGARDHGTSFETILIIAEKTFHFTDYRHIMLMRHIVTHLFFALSALFGYLLAYKLFNSQGIACLAFVMLALMPRIYGHSFTNSKDIPFLSFTTISLYFSFAAFQKRRLIDFFVLGIICGFTTSIRITGILMVMVISAYLLADVLNSVITKKKAQVYTSSLLFFIVSFCASLYFFWPILWRSPVNTFFVMFKSLSHYPWNGTTLFRGSFVTTTHLPLSYVPVWFIITVPVIWLIAGIGGILLLIMNTVKNPTRFLLGDYERNFMICFLCFLGPGMAVIVLRSVVYDDWRHLYFIYPPFVFLALYGISQFIKAGYKKITIALCSVQITLLILFMLQNHPFEALYFNEIIPKKNDYLRKHYELDYWGISYKQGLEYLLKHDTSAIIKVSGETSTYGVPLMNNISMLNIADRKRFLITAKDSEADYLMADFRWHPEDYPYPAVYKINVLNSSILCIYKLH